MKKLILLILGLILIVGVSALQNPSYVYCTALNHTYLVETQDDGSQTGVCVINGTKYNAWDFFAGKVAQEHSYCALQGYEIATRSQGGSAYSPEYGVCVQPQITIQDSKRSASSAQEISQEDLMQLDTLMQTSQYSASQPDDEPEVSTPHISIDSDLPRSQHTRDNDRDRDDEPSSDDDVRSVSLVSRQVDEPAKRSVTTDSGSAPIFVEQNGYSSVPIQKSTNLVLYAIYMLLILIITMFLCIIVIWGRRT